MSSPRFTPWLIPETISSGSKPSISPSDASRTQSTGVPSHEYPTVPSPNGISSTHSGRRIEIERAVADWFSSGATTASSMSSSAASARRSVCRPSASIPSSLVNSTRSMSRRGYDDGVSSAPGRLTDTCLTAPRLRVADALEVEAVRGRGLPGGASRGAVEQLLEMRAAAARDLEHRADEDPVHAAHEGVGLDVELEDV